MLEIQKFVRKPFPVDVVKITDNNFDEVVKWCGGEVQHNPSKNPNKKGARFIRVQVIRALNDRQTKAFVGDYLLQVGTSYKIYTEKAFLESFEPVSVVVYEDENLVPAWCPDRFV